MGPGSSGDMPVGYDNGGADAVPDRLLSMGMSPEADNYQYSVYE